MSAEPATDLPATPMTAEELAALPDDGYRYELVAGEVRRMPPAGFEHGGVAMELGSRLATFVRDHGLGQVVAAETGFLLGRDPDTVRAPDAAFVRADRIPPPAQRRGFPPLAPDLVVEIVSPSDRPGQVAEKVAEWLRAGCRLVWVVYPTERLVEVHREDGTAAFLRGDDALDGGDVVPGFTLPLPTLFA